MSANLTEVAAAIARHLPERRMVDPDEWAADLAADLYHGGLLATGPARKPQPLSVQERTTAVLQCRLEWGTAEKITADLDAAGLLRTEG
jgi:hypothetical protein